MTATAEPLVERRTAPSSTLARRTRARGSSFERGRRRLFLPFVAPALALYLLFLVAPLAGTVFISFNKWAGSGPMEWVGIKNYTHIFQDPVFRQSFGNMLVLLLVGGFATFAISFVLTMLLRDMPGRKFARAVIFFPTIVPALVLSILWGFLFQADGLVNTILERLGMAHPPEWLASEHQFQMIVLGIVWTSTGFYTTILMASVDRIPPYLYEDCSLAGANAWQVFRHVTLPLSWDVVGVCAVLWTINSVKTFEFVLAMAGASGSLPPTNTWTSALFAYAAVYPSGGIPAYGASAASAVVILALVAVLVVGLRRLMRRDAVEF
ncbi:hypothetical protein GCM10023221_29990 [Luteimicrobium xylanilyticum]|uniref:Putative ABC transporter permease protein n=1 Tax=Luteimicrobium xylanilyticum TaxID=1133546 RepID=A0A5P9QBF2_9MICO|nr:sugar ABC transporter permease [Luteimicrobium xylanilyticum]QFU98781.1 putative ABC transporter permease protein [Luteimicrobium xylanilyticum]